MKNSKVLIKTIAISIALAMCVSAQNYCMEKNKIYAAVNSGVSTYNIAITKTYNNLQLGASGKLTCQGKTQVQSGYYAEVIVELQQYDDEWHTIKTWDSTDSDYTAVKEYYYVPSGYSYRLKLTHRAYNGSWNMVESFVKYSDTIIY